MYREWSYWGKPVPGFGDPGAELLILGLAPAAHGANRTGRMFTGDRSGDFLYAALRRAGFATQPTSVAMDDGLELRNAYITAAVRCAPPGNRPLGKELASCRPFLVRELELMGNLRAVLALGGVAFRAYLRILKDRGDLHEPMSAYPFAHGAEHDVGRGARLFASYHPSQQNTQTGRLTPVMMDAVLQGLRRYLARNRGRRGWRAPVL
jgi:uracil-DNA glycosylase family 4